MMLRFRNSLPCLMALSLAALPAFAWGRAGHAMVARIAAMHLTGPAQAEVQELLADDLDAAGEPSGRTTLEEIASWPDEIRLLAPEGAYKGWHGRANPVCGEGLGACPDGHCVDALIEHFGEILRDPGRPPRQRNEALKWVVHLVGDLHQPLHSGVARDRGKTPVRLVRGRRLKPGATLHTVWDGELARIALKGWRVPDGPEDAPVEDSPMRWMLESRDVALERAYKPLPGFSCTADLQGPLDLDSAYVKQAVPAIRLQIARAGFRLADRLNLWLR